MRRMRWPFDGATTIALVALVVSVVQFLFTTPTILATYYKPRIVAELEKSRGKAVRVSNQGNALARQVEVSVAVPETVKINLLPDISSEIRQRTGDVNQYRIFIPHLNPGEGFVIIAETLDPEAKEIFFVPNVTVLRSEEGQGEIDVPSFWGGGGSSKW